MPPKRTAAKKKKSEYIVPTDDNDVDVLDDPEEDPEDDPVLDDEDIAPQEEEEVKGGDPDDEDEDVEWTLDVDEDDNKQTGMTRYYRILKGDDRGTTERLSTYEAGRVIGDRASHLDNGATAYIDTKNYTSSIEIAYDELIQRKLPMAILRHVGQGEDNVLEVEKWKLKEMTLCSLPPREWFIGRMA
jgi:DNA-directed RNA polymerase subunit K/omega